VGKKSRDKNARYKVQGARDKGKVQGTRYKNARYKGQGARDKGQGTRDKLKEINCKVY
jgi:hypothetical protein